MIERSVTDGVESECCRWSKFSAADVRLVQHGVAGVQGARQLLRVAPLGGDRGHPHPHRVRVEPRDQGGHHSARRQDAHLQCLETKLPHRTRGKFPLFFLKTSLET
jgi:hypothetical protein